MRAGLARLGVTILLSCAAACEQAADPRAQWMVHVGTDAPVPGFGDRIRIDVLGEDGAPCEECTRTFDLRGGAALPVSFGVVPRDSGATYVRARLFRAEATDAVGEPLEPILDVLGRLPDAGDGIEDVQVVLGMSCFGAPASPAALTACDPSTGERERSVLFEAGAPSGLPLAGSWLGGDKDCASDTPDGMVCVQGGAFLLGSRTYVPFGSDFDPVPEQLVQLSPFFLDADEMTVATYRALVAGGLEAPEEASDQKPHCSYTAAPGPNETASVSCVSHAEAAAACAALGKRLPTEAEWEYAAGGRSLEAPFPWALPDPSNETLCLKAVLARGELSDNAQSRLCLYLYPDFASGPVPGGSSDDVTISGVRNLAGNLSEWVADDYLPYADPRCWGADLGLRTDPSCQLDGNPPAAARGGSFETIPYDAHAYFRRGVPRATREDWLGFRCAKDAK
ncbi:MAG: SUMF1/EgtB/PvdO family nonheme iron enzyme [Myxococcales bacterium]|nr:SUMF1/EgtB/PvdO family nonheme iron enzyme [Myxococcales bacterium]